MSFSKTSREKYNTTRCVMTVWKSVNRVFEWLYSIVRNIKNRKVETNKNKYADRPNSFAKYNIDKVLLTKLLKMTQPEVKRFCKGFLKSFGYKPVLKDGFLFAQGDLPIALVAHMDTVFSPPTSLKFTKNSVTSPTGLGADDRAGIYGILEMVRRGYRPTIILLEDEEIGGIGAYKFIDQDITLDVRYMIELDRQGQDDAVFYDCDNIEFTNYICEFGFKKATGSFSDISIIAPHYGVGAVNLSIGYYSQHTINEILIFSFLTETLDKVELMLNDIPENHFPYITPKSKNKWFVNDWDRYTGFSKYSTKKTNKKSILLDYEDYFSNENPVPIEFCHLLLPDQGVVEVWFEDGYTIDSRNRVFDIYGREIKDAYPVDEYVRRLYYSDFKY